MKAAPPEFFAALQRLVNEHDVTAYVVVAVIPDGSGSLAVGSVAGSKLRDDAEATPRVYASMGEMVDRALVKLGLPNAGNGGGALLN